MGTLSDLDLAWVFTLGLLRVQNISRTACGEVETSHSAFFLLRQLTLQVCTPHASEIGLTACCLLHSTIIT
jgi:hypothetical protein